MMIQKKALAKLWAFISIIWIFIIGELFLDDEDLYSWMIMLLPPLIIGILGKLSISVYEHYKAK
ncbi:hypothetical protein [Candidatus Berkiella aquae]|uniref:Uncharacterized protein n=1 Tax=Candidatus Berkiella aquae TaxID=295108 RepID=A0A0Q9YD09_9GAMM|nr:hypothetical protein [Candidatus Berkiella aquae]MCS5709898.1 hypothetical protein [Candidatus Berkiella aquae]